MHIFEKGTITAVGQKVDVAIIAAGRNKKEVTFKKCASFTDCISERNDTQADNAKDHDVVMRIYNLAIIIKKLETVYGNIVEVNRMTT